MLNPKYYAEHRDRDLSLAEVVVLVALAVSTVVAIVAYGNAPTGPAVVTPAPAGQAASGVNDGGGMVLPK